MRLDLKGATCRWHQSKPDQLHVEPEDSGDGDKLFAYLAAALGKTVQSVGHSVTPYLVDRVEDGVFILTNARGGKR